MLLLKLLFDERVNFDWARILIIFVYKLVIILMFWELGLVWILKYLKLFKIYNIV